MGRWAAWLVSVFLVIGAVVPAAHAIGLPLVEVAKLTASDAAGSDQFGTSVAVSGDTIVVGAPFAAAGGSSRGAVYVFTDNGDGTVTQTATLTASDAADSDWFGYSVGVSGDTIVVGALDPGFFTTENGRAYVFVEPPGGWTSGTETAVLTPSDAAPNNWFGYAVAVSGDTVVVGANQGLFGSNKGKAYVFAEPPGGWVTGTETAILTASDAADGDRFGFSVAASGETIVIGAPYSAAGGSLRGKAYVFVEPSGGWATGTETALLTASDTADGDRFGFSVGVSGGTVVAGADAAANRRGKAYVFVEPSGGWATRTQTAVLTASDGVDDDYFGGSVGVSGGTIVVGAPEAAGGAGRGQAYVFNEPSGGWATGTQTAVLTASDGAGFDRFSRSIAVSGETIVAGTPEAAVGSELGAGAAYVFQPDLPEFLASPDPVAFADTVVGDTSAEQAVTVTNNGIADLVVDAGGVTLTGADASQFSVAADTCSGQTIAPSASCEVTVRFAPTGAGAMSAALSFSDNTPTTPNTVSLSGTGIVAGFSASPASVTFAETTVGESSAGQVVTVTNTGTADLVVDAGGVILTGPDASQFSVSADACSGWTVPPSQTCTVTVGFAPTGAGAKSAVLSFTDNAPGSGTVELTGTAVAPSPTPTATSSAAPGSTPDTGASGLSGTALAGILAILAGAGVLVISLRRLN